MAMPFDSLNLKLYILPIEDILAIDNRKKVTVVIKWIGLDQPTINWALGPDKALEPKFAARWAKPWAQLAGPGTKRTP
ncbi:hypothetical protein L484_010339 [Morus notabilis]|uniref:Uncharacterized protein n=1 Tax=Morus notabilis TaxID=981085 RepID=W9QW20_9ROSA|nr:hypothetical protein L484_010339 [Morus notabilis]